LNSGSVTSSERLAFTSAGATCESETILVISDRTHVPQASNLA
jgi:hypothetical protein